MHQKINVLILFNTCPKRALLKGKKNKKNLSLTILLSSSSLPLNIKLIFFFYYNNIFLSWPPVFFRPEHLFCLSQHKTHWTHVKWITQTFNYTFWGTSHFTVTLTFFFSLSVNRSGPRTSSTTNHKFYMTLGRLHDLWCKQPLMVASHLPSLIF